MASMGEEDVRNALAVVLLGFSVIAVAGCGAEQATYKTRVVPGAKAAMNHWWGRTLASMDRLSR